MDMDILIGFVLPGPNVTGGMNLGMNTDIYTAYIKSEYVQISTKNIKFLKSFKKMHIIHLFFLSLFLVVYWRERTAGNHYWQTYSLNSLGC